MRFSVIVVLLLASSAAGATELTCTTYSKQYCQASGCKPMSPTGWNKIDLDAGLISRSDRNGCDTYPFTASESGRYVNIEVPGRAMVAKFNCETSEIMEVVTLDDAAYLSWGTCR